MSMFDDILNRHKQSDELKKKLEQQKKVPIKKTPPDPLADIFKLAQALNAMPVTRATASPSSTIYPTSAWSTASPASATTKPASYVEKASQKPVTFESVVLDDKKKQMVLDALAQVKNHDLIFETWGFGKTLEKGKAISMLFYGPPGTGKTLLAQAIADKLKKKLKIIGSAEIESSEPGAAERNIRAIFEHAKPDTVLLFDECDSLVYDRQKVGSILAAQVNQLLSSLEKFEGIVIFTTNRLGVLDEAFNRRLSLKLEFEMPTYKERIQIWKRMFPKEAPVGDINWEALASVEISGGYIKNAVLRAARAAATRKTKTKLITQEILVEALQAEVREMVNFMRAKEDDHTPRQLGYDLRKTR